MAVDGGGWRWMAKWRQTRGGSRGRKGVWVVGRVFHEAAGDFGKGLWPPGAAGAEAVLCGGPLTTGGCFWYIERVRHFERFANSGWTRSAPRRQGAAAGTLEEAADRIVSEADGGGDGFAAHVSAARPAEEGAAA